MIGSRVNVDNIYRECKLLNASRSAKNLADEVPSAPKLYDAIAKESATRSRLTSIRCALFPEMSLLKSAIRKIESHLRVAYAQDIKKYGSTVEERNQVVRRILHKGHYLLDSIESAIAVVDMILKDLDQNSYYTSNLTQVLGFMLDRRDRSCAYLHDPSQSC